MLTSIVRPETIVKTLAVRKQKPRIQSAQPNQLGGGVVLVDDHPLLRKGLARIINASDHFTVCGEAGSAEEALAAVRATNPSLVVVDVGLPETDGIELTKELHSEFPNLPILILSMHEEPFYAARALRAGA